MRINWLFPAYLNCTRYKNNHRWKSFLTNWSSNIGQMIAVRSFDFVSLEFQRNNTTSATQEVISLCDQTKSKWMYSYCVLLSRHMRTGRNNCVDEKQLSKNLFWFLVDHAKKWELTKFGKRIRIGQRLFRHLERLAWYSGRRWSKCSTTGIPSARSGTGGSHSAKR